MSYKLFLSSLIAINQGWHCVRPSVVAIATAIVGANVLMIEPVPALERPSGQRVFERAPRLICSAANFRTRDTLAYYYFTIEIPEDAGESLTAVTIQQKTNLEEITFYPNKSRAFFGKRFKKDLSISLASAELLLDRESSHNNGVKVILEKPVEAGNTVTISLRARNPLYGGIYLFGVTAFPEGANSQGMYLGSGRIQFDIRGGR